MYPLFESIKIVDGQWKNLEWHQQRMLRASAALWGHQKEFKIADEIAIPKRFCKGIVKCRLPYGKHLGQPAFSIYIRKEIHSLQLVECVAFDYHLKFCDRKRLELLSACKGPADEILISIDGYITDTSYSNVIFCDGSNWYTPEQALLPGTHRQRLLEAGEIIAKAIHKDDLRLYTEVLLINAMLAFETQHAISTSMIYPWTDPVVTFDGLPADDVPGDSF